MSIVIGNWWESKELFGMAVLHIDSHGTHGACTNMVHLEERDQIRATAGPEQRGNSRAASNDEREIVEAC